MNRAKLQLSIALLIPIRKRIAGTEVLETIYWTNNDSSLTIDRSVARFPNEPMYYPSFLRSHDAVSLGETVSHSRLNCNSAHNQAEADVRQQRVNRYYRVPAFMSGFASSGRSRHPRPPGGRPPTPAERP
jgi:hypothetical protein